MKFFLKVVLYFVLIQLASFLFIHISWCCRCDSSD